MSEDQVPGEEGDIGQEGGSAGRIEVLGQERISFFRMGNPR